AGEEQKNPRHEALPCLASRRANGFSKARGPPRAGQTVLFATGRSMMAAGRVVKSCGLFFLDADRLDGLRRHLRPDRGVSWPPSLACVVPSSPSLRPWPWSPPPVGRKAELKAGEPAGRKGFLQRCSCLALAAISIRARWKHGEWKHMPYRQERE